MLLAGNPPTALREVLQRFFTEHLRTFRDQSDPARLYFADFSLLDVEDDKHSLAAKKMKGRYIDVFKRVELTVPDPTNESARQWRRCQMCVDNGGHLGAETRVLRLSSAAEEVLLRWELGIGSQSVTCRLGTTGGYLRSAPTCCIRGCLTPSHRLDMFRF